MEEKKYKVFVRRQGVFYFYASNAVAAMRKAKAAGYTKAFRAWAC